MLRVGLNPYGISYTIGLHGRGTPRANPNPLGLAGYLDLAEEIGAAAIELPTGMLAPLDGSARARLRERLARRGMAVILSQGSPVEGIAASIACAPDVGATVVRMSLTPVLCGDRALLGPEWPERVAALRRALQEEGARAAAHGLTLAIENHQDFTSAELMELCDVGGDSVGICLDTGNALAVGEDPAAFARTVAPRVRHVHLKDYRAQWVEDGYRLVRCAIGDGAVPFAEVSHILSERGADIPAAIEPGALHARHVRLLSRGWWEGYPTRSAPELTAGLAAARVNRLPENEEWRTPWECEAEPPEIVLYEMDMLRKSVANLKDLGLM